MSYSFTIGDGELPTARELSWLKKRRPNYTPIIKEIVKGTAAVVLIFSVFILAEMAFSQPVCAHSYSTNITTC